MINRSLFKTLLEYDSSNVRNCHGKNVTDYPEIQSELYYRQFILTHQFASWNAEKGINWLIGFSNYINQNSGKKPNFSLIRRNYQFGEIIKVDFFGGFTNELTYDHPAVVLKDTNTGLFIAPITSNPTVYANADSVKTHHKLPKNALPLGYMVKNSTIKLEQTRYISKARVLNLYTRKKTNRTVERIVNQKISDNHAQKEIKESLIYIFGASVIQEMKKDKQKLQVEYDTLQVEYGTLLSEKEELEAINVNLHSLYEEILNENAALKKQLEEVK